MRQCERGLQWCERTRARAKARARARVVQGKG